MQIWNEKGRFIGVSTTQDQRVCDHCGHRFMSGFVRLSRTYSDEAICDRCVNRGSGGERVLPPAR